MLAHDAKAMVDAGLSDLWTASTELVESLDDEASSQGDCKKLGYLARGQGLLQEADHRPADARYQCTERVQGQL